jgi:adenosylmethionine-8-amino-7-oxononanoate aminotransferase
MSDLVARDRQVFWHPCTQMTDHDLLPPVEVVGAEGSHLHLADGTRLLDGISSWWCKSLGHRHPRLMAALTAQAGRFEHVIAANTVQEPTVRLCERLLALAPGRWGRVFLAGDGSTGIEVALKLAVQWQRQRGQAQRTRFANLEDGYHGETIATMSVSDCAVYRAPFADLCFPSTVIRGLPHRRGPEDPRWGDAAQEWPAIQAQLDAVAETLAGVVVEPLVQGAGGMRPYSPDLLVRLAAWCTAHGVLLIADEIATGCGRLGAMLAASLACPAALPDLVVLSKGLTGGVLPLSAVLIPSAIADAFEAPWADGKAFLHSNTYTGNALACAVANAVLDVYAEEDILGRVATHGPRLRAGLAALASPHLHGVRGLGMMAAADLRRADGTPFPRERRTGFRFHAEARARGALLRSLGDTVYLFPPLNAAPEELDRLVAILGAAATAACRE